MWYNTIVKSWAQPCLAFFLPKGADSGSRILSGRCLFPFPEKRIILPYPEQQTDFGLLLFYLDRNWSKWVWEIR